MDLQTIIDGVKNNDAPKIERNAFEKALDERAKKATERHVNELVELVDNVVSNLKRDKASLDAAAKELEKRQKRFSAVERAAKYMQDSMNPLPYFAATFQKEQGKDWCRNVGAEIPCDKSAIWEVPVDFEG